jgi:hypothetical protein
MRLIRERGARIHHIRQADSLAVCGKRFERPVELTFVGEQDGSPIHIRVCTSCLADARLSL